MGDEWRQQAACRGASIRVFYPPNGLGFSAARELCGICPVFDHCREYAIVHESDGFWAGMTSDDRRNERIRRGTPLVDPGGAPDVALCGTPGGRSYHIRHGEPVCQDCKHARRLYDAERKAAVAS